MTLLSDYVIDFLVKKGIKDIFLVSGGGIMYLLDSVGRNKRIRYVANYHEQASATAAESYARVKNSVGACLVTTGPGSTNAITGVAGAWLDSIPMIVISGQVKRELIADYLRTRQIGPQEINIIDMVKPITKYAVTVMDQDKIKYELEKSFYMATSDRPGPVWINIPLDIQGSMIDERKLKGFIMPRIKKDDKYTKSKVKKVIDLLNKSKRPVIIAGQGVRLSGGMKLLEELISFTKIPTLLPFNGIDLLSEDNKYLMGKFGPGGTRCGNFVLQNSDLILSIGASLNVASTGFDYNHFGFGAKKIMVNIDSQEIETKKIKINLSVVSDAREFIRELLLQLKTTKYSSNKKWLDVCNYWKKKYPLITKEYYENKKYVNSYVFFDKLSELLDPTDVLTTGIALDATGLYQTFKVKKGQRAFVNKNFGQMGWSLPAAVGANVGNGRKRTVCVTGDGSFMVNVHELETIKHYKLPIKIFVFNNGGYESIRYTQDNLFHGRLVGSDKTTGVSNPDFNLLAKAHSLPYVKINNNGEIIKKIKEVLKITGPVLCEVNIDYKQKRMPKAASFKRSDGKIESKPLEDMWPFLPKEEIEKNMSFFK
ncbi:MAG: thiamine pyrophosphate-binding protein [Patescibacteria group bacterium]|jgi:acetolactate synthase-1/2/3 large subunit